LTVLALSFPNRLADEPLRLRETSSPFGFALEKWGKARSNLSPVNQTAGRRLLFITGTDTGVGKTLLTSLLLTHLRRFNVPTLAIKPFCSGNRADAKLLYDLQEGDLTLEEINPFFFHEPLAPLVAARKQRRSIGLGQVLVQIHSVGRRLPPTKAKKSEIRPSVLLVEGAGGLLVPLTRGYFILDLIRELRCEVIVVSRNKLGTLNHTLLTVHALENACPHLNRSGFVNRKINRTKTVSPNWSSRPKVVLMQQQRSDLSAASNPDLLADLLAPVPLWKLPFFRGNLWCPDVIRKIEKKVEKTLARILD